MITPLPPHPVLCTLQIAAPLESTEIRPPKGSPGNPKVEVVVEVSVSFSSVISQSDGSISYCYTYASKSTVLPEGERAVVVPKYLCSMVVDLRADSTLWWDFDARLLCVCECVCVRNADYIFSNT